MAKPTYAEVKNNFERVESFGWFLPDGKTVLEYEPNYALEPKLGYRLAAVLFLICFYNGELHVLITKRSQKVSTHKGEDCLPGGIRESSDSTPIETALREAHEETGLDPKCVEVISILPPFASGWSTLTAVTPVVCSLRCNPHELQLLPNTDEVVSVYWLPVRVFFEARNLKILRFSWLNKAIVALGFNYKESENKKKHFVWGLTGLICSTAASIALNRPPILTLAHGVGSAISMVADDGQTVLHRMALTSDDIRKWEAHKGTVRCAMCVKHWPKTNDHSKL